MKEKIGKLLFSFGILFLVVITSLFVLPQREVKASQTGTKQVYYTSNFLQLYWGNIIFSPLVTGQRVKNEIYENSRSTSTSTVKYNRALKYYFDLTDTVINSYDYPTYNDYWNALVENSVLFSQNVEISISTTITSDIKATIGEEKIASLGAAIGTSITGTEKVTESISFRIFPGQTKSLYTYKAESIIYSASHKQTIQTRIFFWWSDGETQTTPGTIKTYGAGYDIVTTY